VPTLAVGIPPSQWQVRATRRPSLRHDMHGEAQSSSCPAPSVWGSTVLAPVPGGPPPSALAEWSDALRAPRPALIRPLPQTISPPAEALANDTNAALRAWCAERPSLAQYAPFPVRPGPTQAWPWRGPREPVRAGGREQGVREKNTPRAQIAAWDGPGMEGSALWSPDGLHFSQEGYEFIGAALAGPAHDALLAFGGGASP